MRVLPPFVFILAFGACDGAEVAPPMDAGTDAFVGEDAGEPPPSVERAGPVRFACPPGWQDTSLDAEHSTVCEPWPEGRPVCEENERLDLDGCVPIGEPCPVGDWPADLPASGIIYVKSGAVGGDGSAVAPFATVIEAVAASEAGDTILIAAGSYSGYIVVDKPLTIRGVCMDTVFTDGAVLSLQVGATVENLRFQDSAQGILVWSELVTIHDVAIRGTGMDGISALGGSVSVSNVSIRGVANAGIRVEVGASAEVRRTEIAGSAVSGVTVSGHLELTDSVVLASEPRSTVGIFIGDGGVRTERVFMGMDSTTLFFLSSASAEFIDTVFEGPPADVRVDGPGMLVHTGSTVELTRTRLTRMRVFAMAVSTGAELTATDVLIEETLPGARDAGGIGMAVIDGGQVTLRGVEIHDARIVGLLVSDATTMVDAIGLIVRQTEADEDGVLGRGIQIQEGSTFMGDRLLLESNREVSFVTSSGSTSTVTNLIVADTRERGCVDRGCEPAGMGVAAYLGGTSHIQHFRITNSALAGVQLAEGGELDLLDGEISQNPIGVNVQMDYELSRLTTNVVYRDNGVNLDARELFVPAPTAPSVPGG